MHMASTSSGPLQTCTRLLFARATWQGAAKMARDVASPMAKKSLGRGSQVH